VHLPAHTKDLFRTYQWWATYSQITGSQSLGL